MSEYSYIPIDMDPTTCEHADGVDDHPVSVIVVNQSFLYRAVLWLLILGFLAMRGGGVEVVVV